MMPLGGLGFLLLSRLPALWLSPTLAEVLLLAGSAWLAGLAVSVPRSWVMATVLGLALSNVAIALGHPLAWVQSAAALSMAGLTFWLMPRVQSELTQPTWTTRLGVLLWLGLPIGAATLISSTGLWLLCPVPDNCPLWALVLQQATLAAWSMAVFLPLCLTLSRTPVWRSNELLLLLISVSLLWCYLLWDALVQSACFFPCQFGLVLVLAWVAVRHGVLGNVLAGGWISGLTLASVLAHNANHQLHAHTPPVTEVTAQTAGVLFLAIMAGTLVASLLWVSRRSSSAQDRARRQFEALFAHSPSVMFLKDTAGRYLQVSHSYAALLGTVPSKVLGTTARDWLRDDAESDRVARIDAEIMASGETCQFEEKLALRDKTCVMSTTKFPIFDEKNRLQGLGCVALDITHRVEEEALRQEAEEKYRALVEQSLVGIYIQQDARLAYVNPKLAEMLGYAEAEMDGIELSTILPTPEAERIREQIARRHRENIRDMQYSVSVIHHDGHLLNIEVYSRLFEYQGRPSIIGVVLDESARVASEAKLRLSATVFENTSEGILITDAHAKIVGVNAAFTRITGYAEHEVLGRVSRMFRATHTGRKIHLDMMNTLDTKGHWQGEFRDQRKGGGYYPVWLSLSAVKDSTGQGISNYVAVFSDITIRKEAEQRLQFLASHDALTHLPNRTHFIQHLEQAVIHARQNSTHLAVLFIDLDRFKLINDSFGHHVGDDLLRLLASRLTRALDGEGTLARLGGDEFTVLFETIPSREYLEEITARLLSELSQPLLLEAHQLFITASIGVAIYPTDGEDASTLLRNADKAMYRAKDSGKNTVSFLAGDVADEAFERLLMENGLRLALERNEFELAYQPQINPFTHQVEGVEALLRWRNPELGMVSPARFIPLAEENGMIRPIGDWVLREACRQLREWDDAGIAVPCVAVNLSPRQFLRHTLVSTVVNALENAGIPPQRLELEVTEGMLMHNPVESIEILGALKDLGVRIAIDDFGTGYSSLSYLKRFPLDCLKIDRSFVEGLPDDNDSAAIAETIVAMARKLGLVVVAEGVETSEQSRFLRACGCKLVQGFFFSKPLPPAQLAAFVTNAVSTEGAFLLPEGH